MIRLEEEKDYKEVEHLTREAFWNVYRPGCFEHLVIHNLRRDACFISELTCVYEREGHIVGHIAYAKAHVTGDNGNRQEVILFGPVSVLPAYQRQGIGKELIEYTLDMAKKKGYGAVVITGNPDYYHRFGFESASKYQIYYDGMDRKEEAPFFMIKFLDAKCRISGVYQDPDCYMVNEADVDEFDKQFPEKLKEKREGQLV